MRSRIDGRVASVEATVGAIAPPRALERPYPVFIGCCFADCIVVAVVPEDDEDVKQPSSLTPQPIPVVDEAVGGMVLILLVAGRELKIVTKGAEVGVGRKAALPTAANDENLLFPVVIVVAVEVVFKFIVLAAERGRDEDDDVPPLVLPPPAVLNEGLKDDDPFAPVTADDRIAEEEEAGLPIIPEDATEEE